MCSAVTMAHSKPPYPKLKGGTYASRTSSNINDLYDDKNVIIVRIRKRNDDSTTQFDDSTCESILQMLNINISNDTVAAQYLYDKGEHLVEIWLQPHKVAQGFANETTKNINEDFSIINVKPAHSKKSPLWFWVSP